MKGAWGGRMMQGEHLQQTEKTRVKNQFITRIALLDLCDTTCQVLQPVMIMLRDGH